MDKLVANEASAKGASLLGGSGGMLPPKILKYRCSEMPFSAVFSQYFCLKKNQS